MHILLDSLLVIGRIVTILPFLLFITIFMGKRSVGELPVFDFLVVLVLGSVVGADIADPKIEHIHTIVAIIVIALLQKVIIRIKLKNSKIGKLLTFEPTIVIYNGEFQRENMEKINFSIDNVLQKLREKNVFHVKDVEIAIIEANGSMSVRSIPEKETVKAGDLKILAKPAGYEFPVILDGVIQTDLLTRLNKDKIWLINQLNSMKIPDETRVFYGGLNSKGELNISLKKQQDQTPPIYH
ncbi:DUF421 domain-containing protein [Bacillus sp. Marseille-P3661]|uniref:DUF421 domain-containing protein n=1 Tax=Bacillus sp. Marseille-P3661 TaxID=1936234 RepID=UPI002155C2C0|nr:DUF421 domain-containing protein [Bacillus sp. Marseille-P3661]